MVDFDNISQTEQDRIFNEIEVSFLGLFLIYLDNLHQQFALKVEKDQIKKLQIAAQNGFLSIYQDLNIGEQLIKQWELLILIRLKEYRKDFKALMKQNIKDFKDNQSLKLKWARIQTITLDALTHIRRGKLDEKDLLRRYLQDWILNVDKIFSDAIKEFFFKPSGYS